jgi:hypothetical protein
VLAYADKQDAVRTRDVLVQVLQFTLDRMDRRAEMRVAGILRRNGYEPRQAWHANQKGRYWYRNRP